MAQPTQPSSYVQGHSNYTIATHLLRTAELEAAFLLPHIKKTDHILDLGCGPGTITTGFAKHASEGTTIGIDISAPVIQKATTLAAEAHLPTEGPGSVVFQEGDVLKGLPYPDNTFDVIFSSQVFGHLPTPEQCLTAITELHRVLKPGGVLATRDAADQHFYPRSLDLDRLWVGNFARAVRQGAAAGDPVGSSMPRFFRQAGFDTDAGKVRVGAGTTVYSGAEARKWLAWRGAGQLRAGDAFHQSWLDVGISEEEIEETRKAVEKWAETDDAWYVSVQCEMLGWK